MLQELPTFYFEVFEYRPKPGEFESYTSYLIRIAVANGLRSIDALHAICFPEQNRRVTRALTDFPPPSFYELPTALVCSTATLLSTTLHHVGMKFDRSAY